MNAETYAVTTIEEVEEARQKKINAEKDFHIKYKNYLWTCLCDVDMANTKVRLKNTDIVGVLRVEKDVGSLTYPYDIKFFPLKKNGEVSLKSKYVPRLFIIQDRYKREVLRELFEIVGDTNAS